MDPHCASLHAGYKLQQVKQADGLTFRIDRPKIPGAYFWLKFTGPRSGDNLKPLKIIGSSTYGTYDTARTIAGLFAFIGWMFVALGVLVVIGGLNAGAPFSFLIAGIGVGIAAIGLLQVAAEQMLRAGVDTADYSRQSLLLQIALAEGRTEIDLRRPLKNDAPERPSALPAEIAREEPRNAASQAASDISKTLSSEAIAVLRKAADRGYQVRFSPDKSAVILTDGGWETSLTSNDEIIKFGQAMR